MDWSRQLRMPTLVGLPSRAARRLIEYSADAIVGPKNWRRLWRYSFIGLGVRLVLAAGAVAALYTLCVLLLVLVIPPVRHDFVSDFDGGLWSLHRLVPASEKLPEPPGTFPGLEDYAPGAEPYGSFRVFAEQQGRGGKWGTWSDEISMASIEASFDYMDGWEQRITPAQRDWIETVFTRVFETHRPPLLVGKAVDQIELVHPRGYWHNLIRYIMRACAWVVGSVVCLWLAARHIEIRGERATGCPKCGYSLVGLAGGVCPECGHDRGAGA
ncbi:MAG: hypothetical protein H6812_00835 [Phycisphaeraceae bacterium]|nr:hypothetical protein [Phycisphaerales bacterium]MCB9841782.1 hypothetical protein [Phycisphaeraceae bacterium]